MHERINNISGDTRHLIVSQLHKQQHHCIIACRITWFTVSLIQRIILLR
jgi:hypothetical protein